MAKDPSRILIEVENLVESHQYAHAQRKLEKLLRSLPPAWDKAAKLRALLLGVDVFINRGEKLILADLSKELEKYLDLDDNIERKAEILHALGKIKAKLGDLNKAIVLLRKSLKLQRELENQKAVISVLNTLASIHYWQGSWVESLNVTAEAIELAKRSGDLSGYAWALIVRGGINRARGLSDPALSCYELASQILSDLGEKPTLAIVLNNLADIEITRGNFSKGLHLYQQALYQWKVLGNLEKVAIVLAQMGRIRGLQGNYKEARNFLNAAITLSSQEQTYDSLILAQALVIMADLERKGGDLVQALDLIKQTILLLEKPGFTGIDLAQTWGLLTSILLEMGNFDEAERTLKKSEEMCESLAWSEGAINNIFLRGTMELYKGNLSLAQHNLEKARKEATAEGFFEVFVQSELSLADLYLQQFMIEYDDILRAKAIKCIISASRFAEKNSLESEKLEAKMLKALAHSISLEFDNALTVLEDVERTSHSLELELINKKARKRKATIQAYMQIFLLRTAPQEHPDMNMISEFRNYIADAKLFLQAAWKRKD